MNSANLSVANDFTPFPFGRTPADGENSAERFRDEFLLPKLRQGATVVVNLDGVLGGLSSSFLEEVFGGLVRKHGFAPSELKKVLKITCSEIPSLVDRCWSYVNEAGDT